MNHSADRIPVTDDWSEELAITEEELCLLEHHLGDIIAAMAAKN